MAAFDSKFEQNEWLFTEASTKELYDNYQFLGNGGFITMAIFRSQIYMYDVLVTYKLAMCNTFSPKLRWRSLWQRKESKKMATRKKNGYVKWNLRKDFIAATISIIVIIWSTLCSQYPNDITQPAIIYMVQGQYNTFTSYWDLFGCSDSSFLWIQKHPGSSNSCEKADKTSTQ